MSGLVVDTSIWVEFFRGSSLPALEDSLRAGLVVLVPLVGAELLSAPLRGQERQKLTAFLRDLPLHDTPLKHWERVGLLRSTLARKGLAVSTPDAHVGQCALDLRAPLWSRDAVFERIAAHTALRLFAA